VAERTEYYAIVSPGRPATEADGLARRRLVEENGEVVELHDESVRRDLSWGGSSAIVEWEHGELGFDLVPVSEEEAEAIVERFRVTWGPPLGM
jgi:hypothetical protein